MCCYVSFESFACNAVRLAKYVAHVYYFLSALMLTYGIFCSGVLGVYRCIK